MGGAGFVMKGQMGGEEGGRVREISGYTQMLESGHAHLLLHKISKILIFQALGEPWLVVMGFL